ncbi:FliH/SctL family protein [Petroclostridium sp. X23]|uniref:FliH/SctL family protein n=1 Tax=Petroclostridium sp. X23 TaxID=3045146 RepID=UPI0024ADA15D|nr:FliH/SctL family protein [Petroclostridium sp. X23]WHH58932.1 FliH/SctL family protein [Petroclostridium sp. X23]
MSNVVKAFQINVGVPFRIVQSVEADETNEKEQPQLAEELDAHEEKIRIIEDAHREAEEIVDNARKMSKKLLEDARKQAEEMRLLALDEAREQGYNDGYQEITSKAEDLLQESEKIKQQAQEQYIALLESAEKDMVDIIFNIAKKVIGDALDTKPDTIHSLTKKALLRCKGYETVVLRISPEDYETVVEHKENIIKLSGFSGELQIKKDLSLHKGGCIVETPAGSIDSSVETQLNAIEQAFYSMLNQ